MKKHLLIILLFLSVSTISEAQTCGFNELSGIDTEASWFDLALDLSEDPNVKIDTMYYADWDIGYGVFSYYESSCFGYNKHELTVYFEFDEIVAIEIEIYYNANDSIQKEEDYSFFLDQLKVKYPFVVVSNNEDDEESLAYFLVDGPEEGFYPLYDIELSQVSTDKSNAILIQWNRRY